QGGTLIVTPPANGAAATLTGIPDSLPANGQVSAIATANASAGPYMVTVSAGGPYFVTYALTNLAAPAHTTYTVGTTGDHQGGLTSATECRTASNTTCTLRDALGYAGSGTDSVVFKSGVGPAI